jgi:hypothetical protein
LESALDEEEEEEEEEEKKEEKEEEEEKKKRNRKKKKNKINFFIRHFFNSTIVYKFPFSGKQPQWPACDPTDRKEGE